MLKFHSARLQTITYLPTEFQAGSFNTLDFYKETDRPTNRLTNRPTDRRTTQNIEDLVDLKKLLKNGWRFFSKIFLVVLKIKIDFLFCLSHFLFFLSHRDFVCWGFVLLLTSWLGIFVSQELCVMDFLSFGLCPIRIIPPYKYCLMKLQTIV